MEVIYGDANPNSVARPTSEAPLAATLCYAAVATIIESAGEVVGCDATEQTITVKISMRPSGVKLGDACWLKWQRHPLPHNARGQAQRPEAQPDHERNEQ